MEQTTFEDYVENRYKKQMEFYCNASSSNRNKYKRFQWTLIILSALTPVLAALDGTRLPQNDILSVLRLNILVVFVASIVAILTTGLKTFNYQQLWATYRSTYEQLKPEIHYYDFSIGPYGADTIDKESLFVSRVEAILSGEHAQWPPAKKTMENKSKLKDDNSDIISP